MANLLEGIKRLWDHAKAGEAKTRAHFSIGRDHVDTELGVAFEKEQHYLQIVINEMFLENSRNFWSDCDPMAFVVSSYIYGTRTETFPFVVGPALLKQYEQDVPLGMIYRDTPVSSLHPYQGGPLTLTVFLNRLERKNNADQLLKVVESISSAVSPSIVPVAYLKMAETVVDGVEAILGLDETKALLGFRVTINPQIKQPLMPSYYALINEDEAKIAQGEFWVKSSRLHYGKDMKSAEPYRENDFILFSINQGEKRTDERTLPFYPTWETARDLAQKPELHYWSEAKANFNTLKRSLVSSPDLTKPDSERLRTFYFGELKKLREEAVAESELKGKELPAMEAEMRQMAEELDKLDKF